MQKLFVLMVIALLSTMSTSGNADIFDLKITELWMGRDGEPDGTRDWIEVTNLGDTAVNLSDVGYDDSNPMLMFAFAITTIELGSW